MARIRRQGDGKRRPGSSFRRGRRWKRGPSGRHSHPHAVHLKPVESHIECQPSVGNKMKHRDSRRGRERGRAEIIEATGASGARDVIKRKERTSREDSGLYKFGFLKTLQIRVKGKLRGGRTVNKGVCNYSNRKGRQSVRGNSGRAARGTLGEAVKRCPGPRGGGPQVLNRPGPVCTSPGGVNKLNHEALASPGSRGRRAWG